MAEHKSFKDKKLNRLARMKHICSEAFVKSIPIMFSYLFVSMAYGIVMSNAGFRWYYSVFISLVVYTGAFQFVLVTLLGSGTGILTIALTALLMNSRQSFYALTFLEEFKKMGKKGLYMIYTMTDETYALDCSIKDERAEDAKSVEDSRNIMFGISFLGKFYWIIGTIIGAVVGQVLPFDFTGIDFCMTALFVTIFIDQWEKAQSHIPAFVGIISGVVCLFAVGKSYFLLPALMISSVVLIFYNEYSLKNVYKMENRE